MDAKNALIFVLVLLALGTAVLTVTADLRLPGNQEGYAPAQPVDFSHRLHAGELSIDCMFCHYGARTSRTAGIPPANLCMNCHNDVTASYDTLASERLKAAAENRDPERILSPEIAKVYRALGLLPDGTPDPEGKPEPVRWTRVHHLPDFVAFDHSVHVARGLACQSCHGPVQTMDRLRQHGDFSMGFCLDCHRQTQAEVPISVDSGSPAPGRAEEHVSTDCVACHY